MKQPLHASAFAYRGIGCLLLGPSGSGKSHLSALALLHGATLIADDHVILSAESGILFAQAPAELSGVLELRGLGIISVDGAGSHPLHLVVELADKAIERLPMPQTKEFLGITLPFLQLAAAPHTPVANLLLYLQAMQEGRILPQDWRPTRI